MKMLGGVSFSTKTRPSEALLVRPSAIMDYRRILFQILLWTHIVALRFRIFFIYEYEQKKFIVSLGRSGGLVQKN